MNAHRLTRAVSEQRCPYLSAATTGETHEQHFVCRLREQALALRLGAKPFACEPLCQYRNERRDGAARELLCGFSDDVPDSFHVEHPLELACELPNDLPKPLRNRPVEPK